MSTLKERFEEALRDKPGATKAALARAAGVTTGAVTQWFSGDTHSLKAGPAARAAAYLGVSVTWLAEGKGPKHPNTHASGDLRADADISGSAATEPATYDIPEFAAGGKMGSGLVLEQQQPGVIHGWKVSAEWLRQNVRGYSSPNNLVIVTGFGDSMRPTYNPGDPLLVDIGVTQVRFDAVYFFRVGSLGYIKRLQIIPGQGLRVRSDNPAYEPWTIKPDMDIEVFGRVLKVWRGEEY